MLGVAEQPLEQQLGRWLSLQRANVQSRTLTAGVALAAGGRRACGSRRRRRRPGRPPRARSVVVLGEDVEVLEQAAAMLGGDGLGVELHAPHRARAVFERHHHPLVGPRRHATLRTELADDRQRVVAHNREVLRDAVEQAAAVVANPAQPSVHHHRRAPHDPVQQLAQTLMAQTHAEHGDLSGAQDVRAHAEVVPALRASRPGRDDDRVEVPARERAPGDDVVADHDRLLAGGRRQHVEDVVGVGVVVVDQQRAHGAASRPRPRALRSSNVCTTCCTGSARSRSRYQIARCLR